MGEEDAGEGIWCDNSWPRSYCPPPCRTGRRDVKMREDAAPHREYGGVRPGADNAATSHCQERAE